MKTITILAISILLIKTTLTAQVTYNSSDFASVGDSLHVSTASVGLSVFDFDTTGTNILWDYSNLPYKSQTDDKWIEPVDGGYKNIWCTFRFYLLNCNNKFNSLTNLASYRPDSIVLGSASLKNLVNHYRKQNNVLEQTMLGATVMGFPLPIEYEIPDTIFRFPIAYNNRDSAESSYVIDLTALTLGTIELKYVSNIQRINHVEGWGELITPYDTFPSVLKMRTDIRRKDTLFLAGAFPFTDTTVTYQWFSPDHSIPVLKVSGLLVANHVLPINVSFVDSLRCINPSALFVYTPFIPYYDSVAKESIIDFTNLSSNADSVFWDFGDGNTSNEFNPNHHYQCPGIKNVELKVYSTICGQPYMADTIRLPVIISDTTNSYKSWQYVDICEGDSIFLQGTYQTTAGVYLDTLQSVFGCDSLIATTLNVVPIPETPTISLLHNVLSSDAISGNQWYDQSGMIIGATNQDYTVVTNGDYYDIVTLNGCSSNSSNKINVIITSIANIDKAENIRIYPNPVSNELAIEIIGNYDEMDFEIFSTSGQVVFKGSMKEKILIGTDDFGSGIYIIKFATGLMVEFKKIIKE